MELTRFHYLLCSLQGVAFCPPVPELVFQVLAVYCCKTRLTVILLEPLVHCFKSGSQATVRELNMDRLVGIYSFSPDTWASEVAQWVKGTCCTSLETSV